MASPNTPPDHEPAKQPTSPSTMLDPTPTYTEATASTPPADPTLPSDLPPDYALLDASQTTFTIHGTFIHNASGPAYQLSSALTQRSSPFRLRRLRAREVHHATRAPLPFDKSYVLYEAIDPPLLDNEYHVLGRRRACLPGVLELTFRLRTWRVTHVPRAGAKGTEILTCRPGGALGASKLRRRRDAQAALWKDAQGRVVATERLGCDDAGNVVPSIELQPELDQTWREVLIMMWATRLWVAFGVEGTGEEGWRKGARMVGPGVDEVPGVLGAMKTMRW